MLDPVQMDLFCSPATPLKAEAKVAAGAEMVKLPM